jgi:hypothetical protein
LTKWDEVKEMKDVTNKRVYEFPQEIIFSRYGYPKEIVTDQGDHFPSRIIEKIMQHHLIFHRK